jgi:hypothetical protein
MDVLAQEAEVQRRAVNKLVTDFPEKADLSTPESALAAYHRATARKDTKAVLELTWWKLGPREIEDMERLWNSNPQEIAIYTQSLLDAEVIEVLIYRDDLVSVVSKLKFPEGVGRHPYSRRTFGRIDGVWKSLGEDRLPSIETASEDFESKKDAIWQTFVRVRDGIKIGRPVSPRDESKDRSAKIAPGEPLGISIEKADLIGRIEWAFLHGAHDITARKTIEYGEIQMDGNGNRTIRYKYYATIWDKDIFVINQVFTFDAKGNILRVEDVDGFPQQKIDKPVNVSTQGGMKELVEDFFSKNFRDITSREPIDWGEVTKTDNGNFSIRHKYRARIWDKETKLMNQIFTFDPQGKFVSVKDENESPQNR